MKYTVEMAEEMEKKNLIGALCDGSIELNSEFLNAFSGKKVRELLSMLPERDRAYYLSENIGDCFFNSSPPTDCDNNIWLDISEIEVQFEGDETEFFEDVSDWTIHEDLAYLYVGYGLTIEVDIDSLRENIEKEKEL